MLKANLETYREFVRPYYAGKEPAYDVRLLSKLLLD